MDKEEITHLARLARIRIEDDEIPKIAENLRRVIQYVSEIQKAEVETGGHPAKEEIRNVMREDVSPHAAGAYTDEILENVPEREGGYVKVRKIL